VICRIGFKEDFAKTHIIPLNLKEIQMTKPTMQWPIALECHPLNLSPSSEFRIKRDNFEKVFALGGKPSILGVCYGM
jgi:hypothetical protein